MDINEVIKDIKQGINVHCRLSTENFTDYCDHNRSCIIGKTSGRYKMID